MYEPDQDPEEQSNQFRSTPPSNNAVDSVEMINQDTIAEMCDHLMSWAFVAFLLMYVR